MNNIKINTRDDNNLLNNDYLDFIESYFNIKIILVVRYGDKIYSTVADFMETDTRIKCTIYFIYKHTKSEYLSFHKFLSENKQITINNSDFIGIDIYDFMKNIYNHDVLSYELLSITQDEFASDHITRFDFLHKLILIADNEFNRKDIANQYLLTAETRYHRLLQIKNNLKTELFYIIRELCMAIYTITHNNFVYMQYMMKEISLGDIKEINQILKPDNPISYIIYRHKDIFDTNKYESRYGINPYDIVYNDDVLPYAFINTRKIISNFKSDNVFDHLSLNIYDNFINEIL